MSASLPGARPVADPSLYVPGVQRKAGVMETNLLRKGIWSLNDQMQLPLESEDLMGQVYASSTLPLIDIDILAWLVGRWKRQGNEDGVIDFTLYEMGQDFYGREPGGEERRALRAGLVRLRTVTVTLVGYDAIRRQPDAQVCSLANIISGLQWRPQLNGRPCEYAAAEVGALRANSFEVQLASWLVGQVREGHYTLLDWTILRHLSSSSARLAKRLWVYLQGEQYKRVNGVGRGQTYVVLGERAYTALGVTAKRADRRRDSVARAAEKICEVDRSYESIVVEPNPINRKTWRLLATRLNEPGRTLRDSGSPALPSSLLR